MESPEGENQVVLLAQNFIRQANLGTGAPAAPTSGRDAQGQNAPLNVPPFRSPSKNPLNAPNSPRLSGARRLSAAAAAARRSPRHRSPTTEQHSLGDLPGKLDRLNQALANVLPGGNALRDNPQLGPLLQQVSHYFQFIFILHLGKHFSFHFVRLQLEQFLLIVQ